eukprot:scaffold14410_cov60-Phaeocystis_antarctica.AAC.6
MGFHPVHLRLYTCALPCSPKSALTCFAQVVTVSDEEMREATRALYRAGVVAEVSGAAAVAAVLAGKLGDVGGMHLVSKTKAHQGLARMAPSR